MQWLRGQRSPGGRDARILTGVAACAVLAACGSSPATPTPSSSQPGVSASTASSSTVSVSMVAASPVSGSSVAPPTASARPGTSTPVPTSAPSASGSAASGSAQTTGPGAATTLTGTLAAGVESGCIVLVDDKGAVLANLIGLDPASAPVGSTVEVKGRFARDLLTTCQQGEPFTVASVVVR